MTEYDWHTTYTTAVETFNGSTPGAQLEQELLEQFMHSPQTVVAAIGKAAAAYKTGNIHSPWGIVRKELGRISQQPHVTAQDTRSTEKTIARAEAWIKHTGLHLTETEIIRHLFAPIEYTANVEFLAQHELDTRGNPGRHLYGPLLEAAIRRTRERGPEPIPSTGGPLADQDTPAMRQRMLAIWQDHQDQARQLEQEAEQRAQDWKASYAQRPTPKATIAPRNYTRWTDTQDREGVTPAPPQTPAGASAEPHTATPPEQPAKLEPIPY